MKAPKKIFAAGLLITGILATIACSRKDEAVTHAETTPAIAVTVAQAATRRVPAGFEETGSFIADESSDIAPLVAGRVVATPVDVGSFVKQGQIICELDHRDAQLKLAQARAQLEEATATVRQGRLRIGLTGDNFDPNKVPEVAFARANYQSAEAQAKMAAADAKRYANLIATGDVSRSAYEKAVTQQETAEAQANAARQQYEGALNTAKLNYQVIATSEASLAGVRAQLAQAEKALDDTTIRAPFDGYVTARPVAAGEYVALTSKIATIVRIGTLKLELQSPEQRAANARVGMKVIAKVAAYPNRAFEGTVSAVNPSIDPNTRVFILQARFPNADNALRPGMFATARVLTQGGEMATFVPENAVFRDKTTDSNQVYSADHGKARLHVVLTGESDSGQIRILSGLTGTETVITSGQAQLYDGAPIEVRSGA